MEAEQLYAGGKPIYPKASASETSALDIHNLTERTDATVQQLLDEIANRVVNQLLKKTDLALWAKQKDKPAYTAKEVGAEPSGSAQEALEAAKEYSDGAYRQASEYTDTKIAQLINGAPETLDTLKEIADAMAENDTVVATLQNAIGNKASSVELQAHRSNDTVHVTQSKKDKWDGYEERIEQVFCSVSDGKTVVASAITDRGVITEADATFREMAENIGALSRPTGNADAAKVLSGYTFSNASGAEMHGEMADKGAVTAAIDAGQSYNIPEGYHNGKGKVTANALSGQTSATATAANISAGKTAWVNGSKVTGTGADNTVQYNAGHHAGYEAGIAAADARVNTSSASYKQGFNVGQSSGYASGLDAGYNNGYKSRRFGFTAAVSTANDVRLRVDVTDYHLLYLHHPVIIDGLAGTHGPGNFDLTAYTGEMVFQSVTSPGKLFAGYFE